MHTLSLQLLVATLWLVCVAAESAADQSWAEKYYSEVTAGKGQKYSPKAGLVPDEKTAIAIAVAVWTPIYGKEKIESEKPWRAFLVNDAWVVFGSLPEGYKGGVAQAIISKKTGEVIDVIHTK